MSFEGYVSIIFGSLTATFTFLLTLFRKPSIIRTGYKVGAIFSSLFLLVSCVLLFGGHDGQVLVPNVEGDQIKTAMRTLEDAGFTVMIQNLKSDMQVNETHYVIEQSPKASKKLPQHETVILTIQTKVNASVVENKIWVTLEDNDFSIFKDGKEALSYKDFTNGIFIFNNFASSNDEEGLSTFRGIQIGDRAEFISEKYPDISCDIEINSVNIRFNSFKDFLENNEFESYTLSFYEYYVMQEGGVLINLLRFDIENFRVTTISSYYNPGLL